MHQAERTLQGGSVFERYYRELLNFLARKVGDRDLAADLAQESYARVYAASRRDAVEAPRALLYTTARNLVTDHYRRAALRDAPDAEADHAAASPDDRAAPAAHQPDAVLESRQRLAAVERAIAGLPARPREAFVLYKLDGLSRPEVAARMGVGVKTVETHLQVAMDACLRELQALEGGAAVPITSGDGAGRASTRRKMPSP